MKKRLLSILLCMMLSGSVLTGCGSSEEQGGSDKATKDDGVVTFSEMMEALGYDITSYVKLGDYSNLEVELEESDYEPSEEELADELEYLVSIYPEYKDSDRKIVEDGDYVDIDYVGKIDGEAFEGGSDSGYILNIGSGEFIGGFEDGLIGAKVGESVTLNLTMPDDLYDDEAIDGKDAVFEVKINGIKEEVLIEADELTDEYVAKNMSQELGVTTVEELKEYVKESVSGMLEEDREYAKEELIVSKLADISEVKIPEELVKAQIMEYKASLEEAATEEGMTLENYLNDFYGEENWDDIEKELDETVRAELKRSAVLDAMIKELDLSVTDEELEEEYGAYAEMYGYDDFDTFCEDYGGKPSMALIYAESEVITILKESVNVITK